MGSRASTSEAGVRKPPKNEPAGFGHRQCSGSYGDYMSGGTVKPDFCGLFLPCFFAFTLSFVRPRRRLSSAPTVDFGRRRAQKLSRSAVAPPPRHTSTFPGRALTASSTAADWVITGRKSALYFSVAWIDVAASTSSPVASGCSSLAGSASISMSRAMVASAYIRQLRSGLPLCCMHGRSRR
jgi:hypothetical protein